MTILDFRTLRAKQQYRERGTVLRTHLTELGPGSMTCETAHPSYQAHVTGLLPVSGLNVLMIFGLGHTSEALDLELVISTTQHYLLSNQNT